MPHQITWRPGARAPPCSMAVRARSTAHSKAQQRQHSSNTAATQHDSCARHRSHASTITCLEGCAYHCRAHSVSRLKNAICLYSFSEKDSIEYPMEPSTSSIRTPTLSLKKPSGTLGLPCGPDV
mmetsp:Transcript_23159/g.68038  ORF Transcript_23159/g.68038 Transcript_23159/m.68038 type:complete len:124 (-) Transcript_23159:299-670(-)